MTFPFFAMMSRKGCRGVLTACFVVVSLYFLMGCDIACAQNRVATHPARNTSRQVQAAAPVDPVPNFWADSGNENGATQSSVDRLDRKNLTMVYHFAYESYHHSFSQQKSKASPQRVGAKSLVRHFLL